MFREKPARKSSEKQDEDRAGFSFLPPVAENGCFQLSMKDGSSALEVSS
ncbi:MAG: hypothetical protein SOV63_02760 [Pyramidobacter porci]|nr:hypothetical protein [Pyramidobacter porci]MDY2647707.1 hypothetical protein [Pyramidobacter porci]